MADSNCTSVDPLEIVQEGVWAERFFTPFKEDFKRQFYHAQASPPTRIKNCPICAKFTDFISDTIVQWVASGGLAVWGEVGVVSPPHLVLPITVEPSKPRLCHGERFLNLWVRDFHLNWITFPTCLGIFYLNISRPPLITKIGISMSVSICRQKRTLDLNGKYFLRVSYPACLWLEGERRYLT